MKGNLGHDKHICGEARARALGNHAPDKTQ